MANDTLVIADIQFDAIKTNLKNYMKTQNEFSDINFEASGISLLLDVLAYTIHYQGFYLNMSVNEMFINTAQLRKNLNAISKSLNYLPRRMTGAESIINLEIKTAYKPSDISTVITIPKYTDFITSGYHFYSTDEYQLTNSNSYKFTGMVIRQGIQKSYSYTSTGLANQNFTISNAYIDNDTMQVYVDDVLWTFENNITTIDETSEVYQVELTDENYVKIIFGDDIVGKIPSVGSTVEVIYTETLGIDSNDFNTFSLNEIIEDNYGGVYDNSKCTITVTEVASGGANYESIESIRLNAPKFYESQGRMVTKNDYIAVLSQNALVESLNVYGGDEVDDPVYGTVYLAIKPPDAYNLTVGQKSTLLAYMDSRNILTINPEFVDVEYFFIDISGVIYYKEQYESQLSTVRDDVETEITTFFDDMTAFESMFKYAKFITAVNNLTKINNTNLTISPYFYFSKIATGAYMWKLKNEIEPGSVSCHIITGLLDEGFYDDENGNILTRKSGNAEIGTVNYETGLIEIFPGYEITKAESGLGFAVYFNTPNNDVFYRLNRKIAQGSNTLTYTRYV